MARRAAVQTELSLIGTLAVLERAYEAKLIPDLVAAISELRAAGGRIGDEVILKALRRFQIGATSSECEDR
jgi:predicted nucleic acid-binding protein